MKPQFTEKDYKVALNNPKLCLGMKVTHEDPYTETTVEGIIIKITKERVAFKLNKPLKNSVSIIEIPKDQFYYLTQ